MVFTTKDGSTGSSIKLVGALIAILVAILVTLLITHPAATTTSFTPLSGLMTLKTMTAEAMP